MNSTVRKAQTADVPAMVELSEQKRIEYQNYEPVFWRKAADSREKHLPWIWNDYWSDSVYSSTGDI